MNNLNYPTDCILYPVFKIILNISQKHVDTNNSSIRIYVNKIENRTAFKIETGYYLELLTLKTMKLLGSNESKITEDKNRANVPHLEITEVVLVHCNVAKNNYQQDSTVLYTFIPNKSFG